MEPRLLRREVSKKYCTHTLTFSRTKTNLRSRPPPDPVPVSVVSSLRGHLLHALHVCHLRLVHGDLPQLHARLGTPGRPSRAPRRFRLRLRRPIGAISGAQRPVRSSCSACAFLSCGPDPRFSARRLHLGHAHAGLLYALLRELVPPHLRRMRCGAPSKTACFKAASPVRVAERRGRSSPSKPTRRRPWPAPWWPPPSRQNAELRRPSSPTLRA